MGAKQLLKSTPHSSKPHVCCSEKKTASNPCLRSFSWHSPCSDLHCIFWLLPTCREHVSFLFGPVSTSTTPLALLVQAHLTMRCRRRVIFPHPLQVLMKCWTPSLRHPSHRSYCFGSVIGYYRRTQSLREYRLFDPNSTPRAHSECSVRSHREKGLLGCADQWSCGTIQRYLSPSTSQPPTCLLQLPNPPFTSVNILTLYLPHSTSQSSDADCYLGMCGKCMGVYSGGRGISHYPLASISRIFWQLTLIYKQYAMENGLMARYVVLLKNLPCLEGYMYTVSSSPVF